MLRATAPFSDLLCSYNLDNDNNSKVQNHTDKIMKAQMARGADFENGSLIKRAKAMVPILVPLFVSAFRRANELAMAMEARCYHGSEGRTKMKPLKYEKRY